VVRFWDPALTRADRRYRVPQARTENADVTKVVVFSGVDNAISGLEQIATVIAIDASLAEAKIWPEAA
jgi:hypothetical protein